MSLHLVGCLQFKERDEDQAQRSEPLKNQIQKSTVYNFLRMEEINVHHFLEKHPTLETLEITNSSKRSGFKIHVSEIRPGLKLPVNKRSKSDYFLAKIVLEDGTFIHVRI